MNSSEGSEDYDLYISDQVRYDIMQVNYGFIQPIINIGGMIGNIMNIVIFLKLGFADTINISLLGLSIADLCVVTPLLWLNLCHNAYFRYSDIPFDSFEVLYVTAGWPHGAFARTAGMITAYIALERCLCVTFPLKVKVIVTRTKTIVVVVSLFALTVVTMAPVFTVMGLDWKFYPALNRTLVGMVDGENTASVKGVILALFNVYSFSSLILVMLCSVLLTRALRSMTKWREETQKAGSKSSTASKKEKNIVVMVTVISVVFVCGNVPINLLFIPKTTVPEFNIYGRYRNVYNSMFAFAFLLESMNSSVNIFIYLHMSRKYRTMFRRVVLRMNMDVPVQ